MVEEIKGERSIGVSGKKNLERYDKRSYLESKQKSERCILKLFQHSV